MPLLLEKNICVSDASKFEKEQKYKSVYNEK